MIKLNVGGQVFCISYSTIRHYPDSMIARLIEQEKEKEEAFLDRCPIMFSSIISVMPLHF